MSELTPMQEFKTSTAQLWYGGAHLLPSLADKFADISSAVWITRGNGDGDFATADSPSGKLPEIYAEWDRLRTSLQDIVARTSTNLVGTGTALRTMAEEFAVTDGQGATEIAETAEQLPPVEVSPPRAGDEPASPPPEGGRPSASDR